MYRKSSCMEILLILSGCGCNLGESFIDLLYLLLRVNYIFISLNSLLSILLEFLKYQCVFLFIMENC